MILHVFYVVLKPYTSSNQLVTQLHRLSFLQVLPVASKNLDSSYLKKIVSCRFIIFSKCFDMTRMNLRNFSDFFDTHSSIESANLFTHTYVTFSTETTLLPLRYKIVSKSFIRTIQLKS